MAGETGGAVGAVDDVTASVLSMSDSLRNEAVSGVMVASTLMLVNVGGIASAYSEAYSSAYDSISGQMGLFETMSVEVQTSVDGMISSLQSQVEYMSGYSENLRTAAQMGVSDGLLSQLSDGSTESAAYLQEIVTNGQGSLCLWWRWK